MPLQNRVTPTGEIVSYPARGLMMGNRGGRLHTAGRTLGPRRWVTRQWICCVLAFRDRHRVVMAPDRYTELFFLDEATAFAAGHRPCFECRRREAVLFAMLWARARGQQHRAVADVMDRVLHAERLSPGGTQRRHLLSIAELPEGTMLMAEDGSGPWLLLTDAMTRWTHTGYVDARSRPKRGAFEVLTPPSIISVLKFGYRPVLHGSAGISR